ncbi:hypothetical protein [Xylanibacter rodentium]|uniref:hypothetical protein n=1 Tax=Xylanibacter rodentium TaxID=2736289 RepID=UPI00258ED075|nr:hypothetical protein [Xylanibacter rodentium]
MKNLKFLFGAFCAVGMMASCSSSDDVVGDGTTPDVTGQNLYLSVNVMSANEGTRATEAGDPDGAGYEKGTAYENNVERATFYFFDKDGNAANVVKQADGTFVNYYASPVTGTTDEMPNVEKILDATVVINTANGDQIPDKIVAVLNMEETVNSSKSLAELEQIVADYRLIDMLKNFVMSSSVYSKDGQKMMAVDNIQSAFKTSETAAKDAPVDIYVERVLAKVSMGTNMTNESIEVNGETLYYTGQTSDR